MKGLLLGPLLCVCGEFRAHFRLDHHLAFQARAKDLEKHRRRIFVVP